MAIETISTVPLQIRRLSPHAVLPRYQTARASGMDLHAAIGEALVIDPGQVVKIPCGFAMAIPAGYEAQIRPRSGIATAHGITLPNAPGTIDCDYRGPIIVALINLGALPFTVEPKMRIAQMVVAPVARCEVEEVDALDETARGAGGFGSTGKK
jgi:dUTP pyrophosphatase